MSLAYRLELTTEEPLTPEVKAAVRECLPFELLLAQAEYMQFWSVAVGIDDANGLGEPEHISKRIVDAIRKVAPTGARLWWYFMGGEGMYDYPDED